MLTWFGEPFCCLLLQFMAPFYTALIFFYYTLRAEILYEVLRNLKVFLADWNELESMVLLCIEWQIYLLFSNMLVPSTDFWVSNFRWYFITARIGGIPVLSFSIVWTTRLSDHCFNSASTNNPVPFTFNSTWIYHWRSYILPRLISWHVFFPFIVCLLSTIRI